MQRALVIFSLLWLTGTPLAAQAPAGEERRPDIKITRERRTKFNPASTKEPIKEKSKKDAKETISHEDAQVIAHMEMLQNMDLLQDYEKVRLMRLFTPEEQKARAREKDAKDQRKGQRSDEKNRN